MPGSSASEVFKFLLRFNERAMGIEPTLEAWEAPVLPLNHARTIRPAYCCEAILLGDTG